MTLPIVILVAALIVLILAAWGNGTDDVAKKRPHWFDDEEK